MLTSSRCSGLCRVFLADDHNVVRKGLASLLESDPHIKVVGQGSTGEEVLEAIDKLDFDLLLIDLQMPRMNGLETIRRIGKRANRKYWYFPCTTMCSSSRRRLNTERAATC